MLKLAPSILSADFLNLGEEIDRCAAAGADYLHFDVMDGAFVPNISFGLPVLRAASRKTLPCDVHLMIEKPERYVEEFAKAGAKIITVHAETVTHLNRVLRQIRETGCLAGVALCPATPPEVLSYALGEFDLALVMTVNPGFGGQKIIPSAVRKIGALRKMLAGEKISAEIEVDGNVSLETAPEIISQGADILVAGSAFFMAKDANEFARKLRQTRSESNLA